MPRSGAQNGAEIPANGRILPQRSRVSDIQEIGRTIRAARQQAGLTQRDLADLSGISERTVRSIETGAQNPSIAAVASAAGVLGLRLTAVR